MSFANLFLALVVCGFGLFFVVLLATYVIVNLPERTRRGREPTPPSA